MTRLKINQLEKQVKKLITPINKTNDSLLDLSLRQSQPLQQDPGKTQPHNNILPYQTSQ